MLTFGSFVRDSRFDTRMKNLMGKKWKESEDSKELRLGKGREFFRGWKDKEIMLQQCLEEIYIYISIIFLYAL